MPSKKQRVRDFVASRGWEGIGEAEWNELKSALPDVSESTIRQSGIPLAQPWRGVQQHTMDELETSLREMTEVYLAQPRLRRYCREQVIGAKARARFARDETKLRLKTEMIEWMLVWLDDPAMFPAWAALRRDRIG